MIKVFTVKQWRTMEVHAEPTKTTAQIRKDEYGNKWAWMSGGKRVTAKRVK